MADDADSSHGDNDTGKGGNEEGNVVVPSRNGHQDKVGESTEEDGDEENDGDGHFPAASLSGLHCFTFTLGGLLRFALMY